jgi:hypothetical protein
VRTGFIPLLLRKRGQANNTPGESGLKALSFYQKIKTLFQSRDKKPVPVKGLSGVYSLKRLAL